jgi:cellulose synthase operon protein C
MKVKTLKRLAILIAVLSLVGGTGFLTQQIQVKRMARTQLDKAELALKKPDFVKAQTLLREHLEVFPKDVEIQIKYAGALREMSKSPNARAEAFQIYNNILKQAQWRDDVRKLLLQLKVDMGHFLSSDGQNNGADADLAILLRSSPDDGNLLYLMGRCYEEQAGDPATPAAAVSDYQKAALDNAVLKYQGAIKSKAPQRIEAGERLATLLRSKRFNKPKEADKVINTLPKDYQGYLARGRYWLGLAARDQSQKSLRLMDDATENFEKARGLAPSEPEAYLQLAKVAENEPRVDMLLYSFFSGRDRARQILKAGLEKASPSNDIYEALAHIELSAGKIDEAITVLERGLESYPDQSSLRLLLAKLMAQRGDTGKLALQIEELKKHGFSPAFIQFLSACYYINNSQFVEARRLLVTLQTAISRTPDVKFKSTINVLLAKCYGELGEPEMQQNAYLLALGANPQDLTTQLGWADTLLRRGDTTGAIKEYRVLAKQFPHVRPTLARLLLDYNQRRPALQHDWNEVKELIDQVADETVESVLRARLLFAQGDQAAALLKLEKARAGAQLKLEKARKQSPKSQDSDPILDQIAREQVEIWVTQAKLLGLQGRVDNALALLDQAQQQLGDRVEFRLERATLWASKKGDQTNKDLEKLSGDVEKFSKPDRKRLLDGLAIELIRRQDLDGASRLWTKLAEEYPTSIDVRHNLLDLALQNDEKNDIEENIKKQKDEIENIIKQIERIEGNEGLLGRYCQVRYLIWQANRAADKDRETIQHKAHLLLDDLRSRRGDWSVIPLASAQLAEPELARGRLRLSQLVAALGTGTSACDGDEIYAKAESIIGFYEQAIKLGQHNNPIVVQRAVRLLFENRRGSRVVELLSSIPEESQLGGDLERAGQIALEKQEFQLAEQLARKAVEANPDDNQKRLWLANIVLRASKDPAKAAKTLRDGVDRSPSDPDRWILLVFFMINTKQLPEAEKAIGDAEAKLGPKALAQCCEWMGQAHESSESAADARKWNDKAMDWYKKAEAAQPADLEVKRSLTGFLLKNKKTEDARKYLNSILEQIGSVKDVKTRAWARRTLAQILAAEGSLSEALAQFEPDRRPAAAGQEGMTLDDPEDLRSLARILELRKSPVDCKRAIAILEALVAKNRATSEDRFALAHLYEINDDWPSALQKYRELSLSTKNLQDRETVNRRPFYLAQFTSSVLRHHKPGEKQDLNEAQLLVDDLRQLQPKALGTLALQVEIYRIDKQTAQAEESIKVAAGQTDLPQALEVLASLSEKIERFGLAEELYRRLARQSPAMQNQLPLALFLGRRDRVKDALDICKPPWTNPDPRTAEVVAVSCIIILFGSENAPRTPESAQIERVAGWLDQAITQAPGQQRSSSKLFAGLGNLRERQGRYPDAKKLYLLAAANDREGISYNNLAWLAALYDGKFKEALGYAKIATDRKPNQPDFLDTRGVIYLADGQPQLALEDLKKAVAIDPSSPSKEFHLAQAFLASNDKVKARESLKTAKAKGLTPNVLHALERPSYQSFLKALESP